MIEADPRIGDRTTALIDEARSDNGVGVAPVPPWEAAMLVDKQRLALGRSIGAWFDHVLAAPGLY